MNIRYLSSSLSQLAPATDQYQIIGDYFYPLLPPCCAESVDNALYIQRTENVWEIEM